MIYIFFPDAHIKYKVKSVRKNEKKYSADSVIVVNFDDGVPY